MYFKLFVLFKTVCFSLFLDMRETTPSGDFCHVTFKLRLKNDLDRFRHKDMGLVKNLCTYVTYVM